MKVSIDLTVFGNIPKPNVNCPVHENRNVSPIKILAIFVIFNYHITFIATIFTSQIPPRNYQVKSI